MIRIMIVDDEPLLAYALRKRLENMGLEIVGLAHNGQRAVALARDLRPDVIFMDIRMPIMDGIEATRQIMAENPAYIVVLSALVDEATIDRACAAGAQAYLKKPVNLQEMIDAVQNAQNNWRLP